jgi:hypothetical protein
MRRVPTKFVGALAAAALIVPAAAFTTGGHDPVRVSAGSPFAHCSTAPAFTNAEVEPLLASDPHHPNRLIAVYQQDRYHSGGARGIVAAFTMSILLQIGIVDVTSGLLLCAAVSGIGVVLYARASVDPVADDVAVEPSTVARVVHGLRSAARG